MDDLTRRITEIETWDRDQCLAAWSKVAEASPGFRPSIRFLRKALIFEAQCKILGGHSAAIRRLLKAGSKPGTATDAHGGSALPLGTQLVREWNGRIYRVNVKTDGFEIDGENYNSLSAVAKRITGAEWSGPRFFGLKKRAA